MWKKGNEYGTLSQRGPRRLLVEFWGFLSPNHWEAQRPFDSVFFFLLLLSLAWCACDSPNDSPEVLKMRSPSFRLVNLRDLWQRGETFCRRFGDLPAWPCQRSPLLSRTREWWEGGWVDVSRQPSGGGQIFSHATWGGDPGLLSTLRHAS